ncbi:MAG: hypothetical protein KAU17_00970 [Spirochaetales bacterium]|nr:hypothetical protein [Spirochaetales bacterium]
MAVISSISELPLSNRAGHSILKIARTIADLDEKEMIEEEHLLENLESSCILKTDTMLPGEFQ